MKYFISGHLNLTQEEFDTHYAPKIFEAATTDAAAFVMGDAPGADAMAQEYLYKNFYSDFGPELLVLHMFGSPRNNHYGLCTYGGFQSDKERDEYGTSITDADIAWVRPGREASGTAKNLIRRKEAGK